MGWTRGWRKPGSITSLKEKSPSSLPLPKLVSPDLPGVLVDDGNWVLAPLQGAGGGLGEPVFNECPVQPTLHVQRAWRESVRTASQLFTSAQPVHLWAPLDRGETQGLQTRAFRNPSVEFSVSRTVSSKSKGYLWIFPCPEAGQHNPVRTILQSPRKKASILSRTASSPAASSSSDSRVSQPHSV